MKTRLSLFALALLWAVVLINGALTAAPGAQPAAPPLAQSTDTAVIESIRIEAAEIVVVVRVPTGVKKVTLESRPRLGAGTWVPRAVRRRDEGAATTLTFRLARSLNLEVLRVRGDAAEPLPANFYAGPSTFGGQLTTGDNANPPFVGGLAGGVREDVALPPTAGEGAERDVVESDIWVVRGERLYFFNQYRGLQVIDLTRPDAPIVRGTLPIPAAGEKMYLLGERHAVLLARDGCGWAAADSSQVLIVDVTGDQPQVVKSLTVPGYITESRLVGTALYVASQSYREVAVPPKPGDPAGPGGVQWDWGTVVSSFDLADPAGAVAREPLWFPGYAGDVVATDRFLFVLSHADWNRTTLRVIDISAADGAMAARATVTAAGHVADKFKLNLNGDVLTVISYQSNFGDGKGAASVLETFSLTEPASPRKLGQLVVGRGESLFATRFDGDRAYLVTFLRLDPLWIIDLKDPANPRIAGELEVPGWSSYIQPLGDRLVAIGNSSATNWQVAVSLFDVRDPARPALLAKVPVGETTSWSEASYDEKAVAILPADGLILLPYSGDGQQGWASRVQLIELGADTLKARGVIEHDMQPRRATVHGDRILSLSGRELLTVNAADRDRPLVTSSTELSWSVDRVVRVDRHLIEVENSGGGWDGTSKAVLRVVGTHDPETVLARSELAAVGNIVGTTLANGRLHVLQLRPSGEVGLPPVPEKGESSPTEPPAPKPNVFLTIFDVTQLPALPVVGRGEWVLTNAPWAGEFRALWPRPDVLVWGGAGGLWWGGGVVDAMPAGRLAAGLWWPGWWGGGGTSRLLAFDVANPQMPRLVSDLQPGGENGGWSGGETFLAGGLVYVGHQISEFIPDPPAPTKDPEVWRPGRWSTKHFLTVVDYADAANPTIRPAVELPGRLTAVSHAGAVLYSVGPHFDAAGQTDWQSYLDVSAYDGVQASLVTAFLPPKDWTQQLLVVGDTVLLSFIDGGVVPAASRLESYQLNREGTLAWAATTKLEGYLQSTVLRGKLLAVAADGNRFRLFDATDPLALAPLGESRLPGCYWSGFEQADGSIADGLWLPLGGYGLGFVPVLPRP